MKKIIVALFVAVMFNCGLAQADLITTTFTGDNNVSIWNGSSWSAPSTNWESAATVSNISVTPFSTLYFAVSNDTGSSGNPAGFLASFTDTTTGNVLFTNNSSNFHITIDDLNSTNLLTVNPTSLSDWFTPTSYGANGTQEWGSVLGGPVSGISTNSQWIWTANNNGNYAQEDNFAIVSVNVGSLSHRDNILTTPEPSSILLFAFAGAMLVIFYRRRLGLL